jgi:L-amino acid N-acyltransferase YncA
MIRDADPSRDAAACAAIYAPYVESSPISFEEQAPNGAEMAARIERTQATHPWLVAERGGEVVAFAYSYPHRERPAYRWAVDVSVYVGAEQRGQGHGRALYEALFGLLRRQGVRTACAGITLPNEASVGLHEALGFERAATFRRIGWKEGAWRDVGWWQLQLGAADDPAGEAPPAEPGPRLPLADD